MDDVLVENWNRVVAQSDEVFHLGDLALGDWTRWEGILSRLNGHKTLVLGNHDRLFSGYGRLSVTQRDRFAHFYARFFDRVVSSVEGHRLEDGTEVNLSHFPYDGDSHGADRYAEYRLKDFGVPLIHGHTHSGGATSRSALGTTQVHVGVDAHQYEPVSEGKIMELLARA